MSYQGLTGKEVEEGQKKYGPNEIVDVGRVTLFQILFRQVKSNLVVYFLIGATILAFIVKENVTAYAIIGVITLVISIGFFQEYKAEGAMAALKKIVSATTTVVRDGKEVLIPSRELIPGDVIILSSGEKIPADCVVLEASELRVNESVLTGESKDVAKTPAKEGKEPGEENLLSMGTFIVNGRCEAKVLNTGMSTKFGKIAKMISKEEKVLPLQQKVNKISTYLVYMALGFALMTGLVMILQSPTLNNEFFLELAIVVIAIAVGAFPEGFPVTLIATLSAGAYRMAQKNAIVNRMSIIETLGETTIICSDKTGTITKGEMTSKKIYCDGRFIDIEGTGYEIKGKFLSDGKPVDVSKDKILHKLLTAVTLCNDAKVEIRENGDPYVRGSPTEAALIVAAKKAGIEKKDIEGKRTDEIPFSSARKMMSISYSSKEGNFIYVKGAPEILLKRCTKIQKGQGVFTLTEKERKRILESSSSMSKEAYRTLGVAYKKGKSKKDDFEKGLIFIGLIGMEDPPRDEIKESVVIAQKAGIRVMMITGDNRETASSVAKQIGLEGKVMSGDEMDGLSDEEFSKKVDEIVIFARVRPEHKMRIVNTLKNKGEIVTMTGDGVNDAPALKAAHVGVAMGKNGTDVSREVSDLIIKDDNFATIVTAVGEGRTILSNTKRFLTYEMACIYAEVLFIFIAIAAGLPLPLVALQILFLNLVTSDMPSIMLGLTPHSPDVMNSPPKRKTRLITRNLVYLIAVATVLMSAVALGVFYYILEVLGEEVEVARTSALLSLVFMENVAAFSFVSARKYIFRGKILFKNKYLLMASAASILASVAIIYIPYLHGIFETAYLAPHDWFIAIGSAIFIAVVFDILKFTNNKWNYWKNDFI